MKNGVSTFVPSWVMTFGTQSNFFTNFPLSRSVCYSLLLYFSFSKKKIYNEFVCLEGEWANLSGNFAKWKNHDRKWNGKNKAWGSNTDAIRYGYQSIQLT